MHTKVINLYGGSGIGKSTTAAGLFAEAKMRGTHCELVREFVKTWAWQGRKVGPLDQAEIFGNQFAAESNLYNKVDFIFTDSPLLLSPIYEEFYAGKSILDDAAFKAIERAKSGGVSYHNFFLQRHKPFDTRGRYETEETAKKVDEFVKKKLAEWDIPYSIVKVPDRERVNVILKELGL